MMPEWILQCLLATVKEDKKLLRDTRLKYWDIRGTFQWTHSYTTLSLPTKEKLKKDLTVEKRPDGNKRNAFTTMRQGSSHSFSLPARDGHCSIRISGLRMSVSGERRDDGTLSLSLPCRSAQTSHIQRDRTQQWRGCSGRQESRPPKPRCTPSVCDTGESQWLWLISGSTFFFSWYFSSLRLMVNLNIFWGSKFKMVYKFQGDCRWYFKPVIFFTSEGFKVAFHFIYLFILYCIFY